MRLLLGAHGLLLSSRPGRQVILIQLPNGCHGHVLCHAGLASAAMHSGVVHGSQLHPLGKACIQVCVKPGIKRLS